MVHPAVVLPGNRLDRYNSQVALSRHLKLGYVVALALLCVSADFVLRPIDGNPFVSHRNRTTRSVRTECEHETALLHEPVLVSSFVPQTALSGLPTTKHGALLPVVQRLDALLADFGAVTVGPAPVAFSSSLPARQSRAPPSA
jgi:hypothetical protein